MLCSYCNFLICQDIPLQPIKFTHIRGSETQENTCSQLPMQCLRIWPNRINNIYNPCREHSDLNNVMGKDLFFHVFHWINTQIQSNMKLCLYTTFVSNHERTQCGHGDSGMWQWIGEGTVKYTSFDIIPPWVIINTMLCIIHRSTPIKTPHRMIFYKTKKHT